MKISISSLSDGVHTFQFSLKPGDIDLAETFTGDISVQVTLDKSNREVLLRGESTAAGVFTCDRCLENFQRSIQGKYQMYYVWDERDAGRFQEEDVVIMHENQTSIDLTGDLREFLLLSIPLKMLCREECQGLCPRCGANWNEAMCSCPVVDGNGQERSFQRLEK